MDFEKMKKLIHRNGDTFIFVEEGEPEMVLLSFDEYERLTNGHAPAKDEKREQKPAMPAVENEFLPAMDGDMYAPPYSEPDSYETQSAPLRREDVRLEDLPI